MSIIIEKIEFNNFRQYGTGTIEFDNEKESKLSVIVAKNGTGKTTFLNSITWCLYEIEQQLGDKKSALPVISSAVLESALEGEVIEVSVAVTIQDGEQRLKFKRVQNFKKNFDVRGNAIGIPGVSSFYVETENRISGVVIEEDSVNAEMKVKKYFDPAIFDFYFFDGEQLKEFFAAEKTSHIRGSIHNIAQVTLLQTAYEHVEKIRSEKMRAIGKGVPDLDKLLSSLEELEEDRKIAEQLIVTKKAIKEQDEKILEQIDELLRGYTPIKKLQDERKDLENKLVKYESSKKELREEFSDFIRKYIVLLNLYPNIVKSLEYIEKREKMLEKKPVWDKHQIRLLLDNLDKPCPLCTNPSISEKGKQHLENMLLEMDSFSDEPIIYKEIKGSLEYYIEEVDKYQARKNVLLEKELELEEVIDEIEDRLKVISSSLANFSNSESGINVNENENRRARLKDEVTNADRIIGASENKIIDIDKEIVRIQKQIDEAQSKIDVKNELKKQVSVLVKIEDNYKIIKDNITSNMRREIESTTWKIFDSMIWKRNTFGKITIGENYDISVYNQEDAVMTGSLSATEQMALAYAFTLAIHEASGKNCPLVIDSPLGRVSDENRVNMAKALLDISKEKQIIMLFTPDEYSDAVRKIYANCASVRMIKLSDDEKYIEGMDY